MCAICGLLMVALPVSVVATNFSIYYSYAKARIKLPPKKKVKAGEDANKFLIVRHGKNIISPEQSPMLKNDLIMSKTKCKINNRQRLIKKWHDAVDKMKRYGMIQPRKMDLAQVVSALSSKGEWIMPNTC